MSKTGSESRRRRNAEIGQELEQRVLVVAPFGRDTPLLCDILGRARIEAVPCSGVAQLVLEIARGAAATVVSEEALPRKAQAQLKTALLEQPSWSDLPVVVLFAAHRTRGNGFDVLRELGEAANLTLLERPLGITTMVSAVRTAIGARRKQYRVRDELEARQAAEASLKESEERLLFAQRAGGVGVFDWDMRSASVMWTGGMEELFGLPIGTGGGSYDDWSRRVYPEDIRRLRRLFSEWTRSDRTEEQWDYRFRHPDGGERWISARARIIRDETGAPIRMIGANVDVTAQKKVESELRRLNEELEDRIQKRTRLLAEAEAKYRGLVENTRDIPFHLAADGRIRYVGPQVMRYGFSPKDLQDRPFRIMVFKADRRRVLRSFRRMLEEGRAGPLEFRVQAADGRRYWLEERGVLHADASGTVTGLTGVLRDITQRKEVEEIQARQQSQLRQLAARLASAQDDEQRRIARGLHDDVAQLLAACSVKMALAEQAKDPIRLRKAHNEIDELLSEATEKIRSLSFELFSSTLGRLGLAQALRELCQAMSERYRMHFRIQGDEDLGGLDESTELVLFKGVRELLFNVVKHAGVKEARVLTTRHESAVEVGVEDRGAGFPEVPGREYIGMGKGLGLFGLSERMRELGGELRIESTPGVLTRVTLSVPAERMRS